MLLTLQLVLGCYGGMARRGSGSASFSSVTCVGEGGDRKNVNEWISIGDFRSCLDWGEVDDVWVKGGGSIF